jgi:signal transduction histidine kinase
MQEADTPDLTLAGLVHDLNNVFQTITEAAELVSEDPKWESAAAVIFRGVEQGRRIVAGIVEAERETANIDDVLDSATHFAQDFVRAARCAPLTVSKRLHAGLSVITPPAALERVFINLFINSARAATEAERTECTIRVSGWEQNGRVQILIADNGPGIDPGILSKIFAPGFSTSSGRSGLGLHIVDTIIRENSGQVSAANSGAGGAEFTIVLPSTTPFAPGEA